MKPLPQDRQPPSAAAIAFGATDIATAAVVGLGVFGGLPSRWAPVDVPAALLCALMVTAGAGLLAGARWATAVARVAAAVALGLGLVLIALLVLSVGYLSGLYGPVGRGGAVILALVAALALPYLVALPAGQLVWLSARRRGGAS